MNKSLFFLGLVVFFSGLLWASQGMGYIQWPESSFMIKQTQWAYYGAITAVIGIIIMIKAKF